MFKVCSLESDKNHKYGMHATLYINGKAIPLET